MRCSEDLRKGHKALIFYESRVCKTPLEVSDTIIRFKGLKV